MKWIFLALVSIAGWFLALLAIPLQFTYRLFSDKYTIDYYFQRIAVGNDKMVGAMVYGSKHTVSAITGKKAAEGDLYHKLQEAVIDYFFGEDHCYNEYIEEFKVVRHV